jgi:hypothetical protein
MLARSVELIEAVVGRRGRGKVEEGGGRRERRGKVVGVWRKSGRR